MPARFVHESENTVRPNYILQHATVQAAFLGMRGLSITVASVKMDEVDVPLSASLYNRIRSFFFTNDGADQETY